MASEVCEEQSGAYKTNISSPSEPSEASIWRRRDLVSMATFRLTTVEIIRQNQGSNSSVRLQVAAVSCDECGAIPWDELQIQSQPTSSQTIPPSPSTKTELLSSMKGRRDRNSVSDTSFTKEINTGILSIKKGFSNMMTSIDSALKVGQDDASDTFSIHNHTKSMNPFSSVESPSPTGDGPQVLDGLHHSNPNTHGFSGLFSVPPSKIFVHVNPVQIHFDVDSLLWLSSFGLNLHNSLMRTSVVDSMSPTGANEPSLMYMDVKVEAILPRIVFESSIDAPSQRDRPKIMQIQISRASVTNIREMGTSRADLAQALHSLQEGSLVFSSGFPSKEGDLCIVTDRILSHVAASDVTPSGASQAGSPQSSASGSIMSRHALWTEPRDIWCIKLDPIWIEFFGARSVGVNKSIPFLDAVPVTLWLHGKSEVDAKMLPFEADTNSRNSRKVSKDPGLQSVSDLRQASVDGAQYLMPNLQEDFYSYQQYPGNPFHTQQSFDSTYSSTLRSQNADSSSDEKSADLHVIVHVSNLVSLQIDHYQFLFLLRLAEDLTELSTFLSLDTKRIMAEKATTNSIIVGCVVPQVE
uniref:Uncharacterized protein n=1 Tax=Phlebotomus papatasi TaxID=29031 RepID=A0A1B0GPF9_PHLPP